MVARFDKKAYTQAYYLANAERMKESARKRYNENKELIKKQVRERRLLDPEKANGYVRKWRTENPEKVKEHQRKNSHQRRVRLQGGRFERFDYVEIFERDNWICGICTKPINNKLKRPNPMSVSLDHIVPVSRGGGHVKENVQSAHLSCNISKGSNG